MRITSQHRLILDSFLLGIVGALSARVFSWMLDLAQGLFLERLSGYTPPGLPQEGGVLEQVLGPHGRWLIPAVCMLGGLLAGVLVYSLAPEAEGHGTDTAVKAFHHSAGRLRNRVAPLKMLASAITIGSGGAAGREGPTALITGGIGSLYATYRKRTDKERRLLLLIGMAAGLSAIFRSPIGTAVFAVEVLYSEMEFDTRALLYTLISSIIAYAVNGLFVGWAPLFTLPPEMATPPVEQYVYYMGLGVVGGVVGTVLPVVFYRVRDLFHLLPGPPHLKPALGGLLVGLLALVYPQVLGGGYAWIQMAIDGNLALGLASVLVVAKILALSLTISSGGSGGVFAPSLFIGAMLGSSLAVIVHAPPAPFVIIGMAAVFGAAARVPIATLLMVTEMTGGYQFLVSATLAVVFAYGVQSLLSSKTRYRSLYEAQVPTCAHSPAHYRENIKTALHLLREQDIDFSTTNEHVDAVKLLSLGIPLELPGHRQLLLGKLRPESSLAGQTLHNVLASLEQPEIEIVAVFREDETLLPHRILNLRGGDTLLLITPDPAPSPLMEHLRPVRMRDENATPTLRS